MSENKQSHLGATGRGLAGVASGVFRLGAMVTHAAGGLVRTGLRMCPGVEPTKDLNKYGGMMMLKYALLAAGLTAAAAAAFVGASGVGVLAYFSYQTIAAMVGAGAGVGSLMGLAANFTKHSDSLGMYYKGEGSAEEVAAQNRFAWTRAPGRFLGEIADGLEDMATPHMKASSCPLPEPKSIEDTAYLRIPEPPPYPPQPGEELDMSGSSDR